MTYLGITQPTAEWLLGNKQTWLPPLMKDLPDLLRASQLRRAVVIVGPLRIALSEDSRLLGIWNPDYLSNTGAEPWGFVRLATSGEVEEGEELQEETLERCIYTINQRLQGLLIDDRFLHKNVDDVHTCLAGRGVVARQLSIAYVETELSLASGRYRTVVCVGPLRDLPRLRAAAAREFNSLAILATQANQLLAKATLRPPLEGAAAALSAQAQALQSRAEPESQIVEVPKLSGGAISAAKAYEALEWNYDDWTRPASSLTGEQRRVLEADILLQNPLRLIGAAGSGKTLLMQLLAVRRLRAAETEGRALRVLYVVHNIAMMNTIWLRFVSLGAGAYLEPSSSHCLEVRTLFDYSREVLDIDDHYVIDPDAQATKAFQQESAEGAIAGVFERRQEQLQDLEAAPVLGVIAGNETLRRVFAELVVAEIGVAIKGHGLESDRPKYVGSERPLSRLHGALTSEERDVVFDIFEAYRRQVFEELEILDTDDLALSLLGRMRTPIWEMKRRKLGYDFIFVDETQLFSENERRLFPLLTRGDRGYVPVALALDQAQETRGAISAGLGLLGITAIADEKLHTVQRSTPAILKLAFNVIQHTTDLFGPDFPDFTRSAEGILRDDHPLAEAPMVLTPPVGASLAKFVMRHVQRFRREGLKQVAVVVHAEEFWEEIRQRLTSSYPQLIVMKTRGERINPEWPAVVLSYPNIIGGQEFDGVVAVGVEQGRVPPRVQANDALAATLEQRALRELYVSFTRARYRLLVVNSPGSAPSALLADAMKAGLLSEARGVEETT